MLLNDIHRYGLNSAFSPQTYLFKGRLAVPRLPQTVIVQMSIADKVVVATAMENCILLQHKPHKIKARLCVDFESCSGRETKLD